MEEGQVFKGKISFINYEKHFATIDYLHNNKAKSVNFKTNAPGSNKKAHQYKLHDSVSFQLKLSDRGDKMTAYNVKFGHNEPADLLLQKTEKENRFAGYLKVVDGKFFVKEIDSYILFPVQLSRWEKEPVESAANVAISFKLVNIDKPNALAAELFSHNYIPEYKKALQHFNNKIDIDAVVHKISPHGVYLDLFGDDRVGQGRDCLKQPVRPCHQPSGHGLLECKGRAIQRVSVEKRYEECC